ncbi:hypothetical protein LCGC14_2733050 [marine sediment metagenome]|uniref:Uncharacterized protein n=1 Tax=marine sediment metagenome TaxID=412755 RepID=A0A0F8Z6S2_9ZZZZ
MIENSITPFALLLFGVVCVYAGIWIGRSIEAYRWRYYANEQVRMNSDGNLYMNSDGNLYEVREVR